MKIQRCFCFLPSKTVADKFTTYSVSDIGQYQTRFSCNSIYCLCLLKVYALILTQSGLLGWHLPRNDRVPVLFQVLYLVSYCKVNSTYIKRTLFSPTLWIKTLMGGVLKKTLKKISSWAKLQCQVSWWTKSSFSHWHGLWQLRAFTSVKEKAGERTKFYIYQYKMRENIFFQIHTPECVCNWGGIFQALALQGKVNALPIRIYAHSVYRGIWKLYAPGAIFLACQLES